MHHSVSIFFNSFFFLKKKKSFQRKQHAIHAALCDSFNTPTVISEIMDLVYKTNIYLASGRSKININIVEDIARYVTRVLRIFGVIASSESQEIGFGTTEKQLSVNVSFRSLFFLVCLGQNIYSYHL